MDHRAAFLSSFIKEDLYLINEEKTTQPQQRRLTKTLVVTEDKLQPDQQVFLEKVFSAVGLHQEDIEHQVHSSTPSTDHSIMFFFGTPLSQHTPYTVHKNQQGQIQVFAHSLAELQDDQEKKRALWQVLKNVFNS